MGSTALIVLSFALWSGESAEAIYAQMRVGNAQIRTMVFEFRIEQTRAAWVEGLEKDKIERWTGTAWFMEPSHLKVEFHNDLPTQVQTITADQNTSTTLTDERLSGSSVAVISEGGASAYAEIPGLATLIMRSQFDSWNRHLKLDKIRARPLGELIRLEGQGSFRERTIEWDVDPQRGFSLLRELRRDNLPHGVDIVCHKYEVVESAPGIWTVKRNEREASIGGRHVEKCIAEVVPGTMKVNVSLTAADFEIRIPNGAEVRNLNLGTRHFQGGTSRNRSAVSALAVEAISQLESAPVSTVSPKPGAVSAAAPRSSLQWASLGGVIVVVASVAFAIFRRWGSKS